jgi:hypothetical protein
MLLAERNQVKKSVKSMAIVEGQNQIRSEGEKTSGVSRPVTPEVAGSSPVSLASLFNCLC